MIDINSLSRKDEILLIRFAIRQIVAQTLNGAHARPAATEEGGRGQYTEAHKAKLAAAMRRRWKAAKAEGRRLTDPAPTKAAKKKARTYSTAARARMAMGAKARWAAARAKKAAAS